MTINSRQSPDPLARQDRTREDAGRHLGLAPEWATGVAIRHTVVFRLVHEPGSAGEAEFLDAAAATLTAIGGVTDFEVNRQISAQNDMGWQFSMVLADQAAYDGYDTHPAHVAFVESRWRNEVAAFQEFDFAGR